MSAPLPHFEPGEVLTAAKLNVLIARTRALQARQAPSGTFIHRTRRIIPHRHYAFELAELSGVLYYRQGWIDPGTGEPALVGDREWNPLGKLEPCTVWLEFSGSSPSDCTAEVRKGEYDDSTPETNFRRRLGYVREQEGEEGGSRLLFCVQVAGGLMTPCAPRRVMGCPSLVEPSKFCKCDKTGTWGLRCAGALYGQGFTVPGVEGEYRAQVSFGYTCDVSMDDFTLERGGYRMTQGISFGDVWGKFN